MAERIEDANGQLAALMTEAVLLTRIASLSGEVEEAAESLASLAADLDTAVAELAAHLAERKS